MFLALQFPFADLREFVGEECGRLVSQNISLSNNVGKDFIRSSGRVERRRKGGLKGWPGEDLFCGGKLALRFPNHLGDMEFGSGSVKGVVVDTFRRFYSAGPVARFEVGVQVNVRYKDFDESYAPDWFSFLRDVLQIPMHKRNLSPKSPSANQMPKPAKSVKGIEVNHPKKVNLIHARDFLAHHYLTATTNRQLQPQIELQPWWYCPGTPALIVEVEEPYWLPTMLPHTRHVLDVAEAGASIFHTWLDFDDQPCSAWILAMGEGDPDAVRRLRVCLTRMHAERECLNLVLAHIGTGPGYKLKLRDNLDQLDAVQCYLENALPSILKTMRFGINQAPLFEVAHDAFGIALEGQETKLEHMGWQLAEKVKTYIRRVEDKAKVSTNIYGDNVETKIQMDNVSVTGDITIVTAKNIQNSFNRVQGSKVNTDLKEKLKTLTVEVAKLAKELPPDDAETVTRDLDTLTSEAVSAKPRRKCYEVSAEGILEAAKFVGTMTETVAKAVKDVVAALAFFAV
jgi:hypothetical protein